MILVYIFIIGCIVTGIVATGLVFAFAAVSYGDEGAEHVFPPQETTPEPAETPNQETYRL